MTRSALLRLPHRVRTPALIIIRRMYMWITDPNPQGGYRRVEAP